jgi:hypothetical protein
MTKSRVQIYIIYIYGSQKAMKSKIYFWDMDPEMSHKNYNVCVTPAKYILQEKRSKDIFLVSGP